ncbi:MAG: hypothetical protein QOE43_1887 [Gaiellaceae bacterium]|jgi:hypothetical protein|nr:hypothetical protein [Gaiellaceae bacterium]
MDDVLDRHVPRIDEPGDWADVLRRAKGQRRPRRRLLAVAAAVVAAFVVAPALAVLLHDRGVQLPSEADRSNVVVIMQPTTGRILIEVAPWKRHDGFCYLILQLRSGCVPRKARGTAVMWPPLFGWTFDPRVRTGMAITISGKHIRLTVEHFGGRVDATLFLIRDRLPRFLRTVVLRDAAGNVVARLHVSH